MSNCSKFIHKFNKMSAKSQQIFLQKFYDLHGYIKDWECKRAWRRAKLKEFYYQILSYNEATIIKTEWNYWHTKRTKCTAQNKPTYIWFPDLWPLSPEYLFNKWCWRNWISTWEKKSLSAGSQSKCIKIKWYRFQNKMRKYLHYPGLGKIFLLDLKMSLLDLKMPLRKYMEEENICSPNM